VKIPFGLVHMFTPLVAGATSLRRRMIPPQLAAMELATGIWPALALRAFVKAGIADRLAQGAATPAEIARDLSLHEPSVRRVLRLLAGYDVVRQEADAFALTEIGQCAAAETATSVADFLRYVGEPWQLEPWARLDETLRTGNPAFEIVYGSDFFAYAKSHPEVGDVFDRAMNAVAKLHADAIAEAYDFSRGSPIADVGGGAGLVAQAILRRYPAVKIVQCDLAGALTVARAQLAEFGNRVEFVVCDFFESVPPAKTYLLTHILHDWDDERALRILANVRRAMLPGGTLLIAEALSEEDPNTWSPAALTDAQMLAMLRGRERSRREFEALLARAGMQVTRVVTTSAAESLIVARCEASP
jgi:ubiquinone/menaquinone biosynthesis C-methylase UbiE